MIVKSLSLPGWNPNVLPVRANQMGMNTTQRLPINRAPTFPEFEIRPMPVATDLRAAKAETIAMPFVLADELAKWGK